MGIEAAADDGAAPHCDDSASEDHSQASDSDCQSSEAERALLWPALLSAFLHYMSFFMMAPYSSQVLMQSPYALGLLDDKPHEGGKDADFVQQMIRTQHMMSVCSAANAICEMVTCGLLGVLCDRIGVKPIGVLSEVGQLFSVAILALCSQPGESHALQAGRFRIEQVFLWMGIASSFAGLCGNLKISTQAYVARVSTQATSNHNFMLLAIVTFSAICVGPLMGILVHRLFGESRIVLWVSAVFSLLALLTILLAWPGRKLLPLPDHPAQFVEAFPCLLIKITLCASPAMVILSVMQFTDHFALHILSAGYATFTRKQYRWGTDKIGLFMVVNGLWAPVFQGVLLPLLLRRSGEVCVLRIGFTATVASFVASWLIGLTSYGDLLFASTIIAGVGFMANPVLASLASRQLPKSEMGRMFAAFALLDMVSRILAPLLSEYVMARTLGGPMPSTVFLCAAAVGMPAVVLAFMPRARLQGAAQDKSLEDSTSSESE